MHRRGTIPPLPLTPRVLPTRRTYAWLAGAAMAFTLYASLIPFNLSAIALGDAVQHFIGVMLSPPADRLSRTNFLANVLLTVPVGFGLAGALLCDRAHRWTTVLKTVAIALTAGLLLSLTVEFLQEFAPGRVPALADVEAQAAGVLAGAAAWLAAGPILTTWLRMIQRYRGQDRLGHVLIGYAVVWTAVNLAPFDITLDLGELSQRMHAGLITIVPFTAAGRPLSRVLWDALMGFVSAIPLGALGVIVGPRDGRARTMLLSFAGGAALVAGMELAQVFLISHGADMTDVLCGWAGVALGVATARRIQPPHHGVQSRPLEPARRGAALLLGSWALVLLLYHWMPYDFTADRGMIHAKVAALSFVPFAGYRAGSDLYALNDILTKLGLAFPLGVLAAFVQRRRSHPSRLSRLHSPCQPHSSS